MNSISEPRLYSDVNLNKPSEDLNCSSMKITWGKQENYEILRKLGRGKYADVYEGIEMQSNKKIVIKILKPIKKSKVLREIKILKTLESCPGIPKLLDILKENNTKTPSLIMEHCENQDLNSLFSTLEELDAKYYLYEILRVLDFAHSKGIIHRDIKPGNVLINHSKRQLKVIDWGLAEYYVPGKPLNVRVASRYYKSPEILTDYQHYDYSLDMWSFGVMFAGLIFKKNPFFHGHDIYDQLLKIVRTLGTASFFEFLEKYEISLDERYEDLKAHYNPKSLKKLITSNTPLATDEAIDLLSEILVFDFHERILPSEAMQHEYFAPVREMLAQVETALTVPSAPDTLSILIANKLAN